jgi:hypothetical protein
MLPPAEQAEQADLPDNAGIADHSDVFVLALDERHPSPELLDVLLSGGVRPSDQSSCR